MPRRRTILCVEDNPALRDNLREILEDAGYAVSTAATCAEAVSPATGRFDVALIDVRLPDGDGIALAGKLSDLAPDAELIMMTGFATLESAIAAVRAGAWAYLMKPCATPDLLLAVEQAVRQIEHVEEKRELIRRAHVAEKLAAIGTLAAGLSHEIKNPLNAASLQLMVLERRLRRLHPELEPELEAPLHLVRDEVARLNRILEDFLQFARRHNVDPSPVAIADVLGRVADLLAPDGERLGVRLERDWGPLPPVLGDAGRLQQALVNLVLNGMQAAQPDGFVLLSAVQEADELVLAVEDSGPGIPDDVMHRVFEPFFTTKSTGSGLGLPLVHNVVEQHGGTISVERGQAGGARFVIRLPAALP